jgi:hypothetical protein
VINFDSVTDSNAIAGNGKRMTMMTSRRDIFKTVGGLALVGGAQNGIAQTTQQRIPLAGCGPRNIAGTPDYTRLSNALLNSYGLAAGNVWNGSSTGTLKSDDLVRASVLLRATIAHLDEIGVNSYLATQLRNPPSGAIPPTALHAIGEQVRSSGIILTDAEIQQKYDSLDPNTQRQALLNITQLGVSGSYDQLASALDLAARKLRLQEIATACGELLDVLPSSSQSSLRAMQASALNPRLSGACQALELLLLGLGYVFAYTIETPYGWVLGVTWLFGSGIVIFAC